MPDAIITSTESTFGTISGTFLETGATIQGTITGVVAGTLDGSVGVPGPQGPQGPQGQQGIQGVPGHAGVGVPTGGTAGQVLAKIDGVNYNTEWVDSTASAVWGNITGTLSSQTDLQTALNGKYSTSNPAGYITSSALTPYLLIEDAESSFYPLTGNPSGFLTSASLSGYATESWVTSQGYLTSSALTPYLTSATAASTYQTLAGMSSYLTTSAAASTYYLQTNPSGFITSSALSPYLLSSTAASTYQTLAGMSAYLTTSAAASTYYPLTGNPSAFLTSASLTGYATESWVTSQGYLTSAPVTSVAGKTGAVTLAAGDISGLGSLAVVNDAPSDGSQYARKNGAWDVVAAGADFISSVSSPLAVTTGNLTVDLSAYAQLSGATFTGNVFAPTPSPGTDSTRIATTEWVKNFDYAPTNSPHFTGNPQSVTPNLSDNDTSIATTAFVKGQGYLTSAPVTSVAGRTGAVTLSTSDISGLGTMATATAADYSTTSVANGLYYPLSSNPAGYLTSAPVTSVAGKTGAVTLVVGDVSGAAPTASPALSGTPTAPTASPGTNTTQLATTAFVTAAVPAFATMAEAQTGDATDKVMSPRRVRDMIIFPGYVELGGNGNSATSGTGASIFINGAGGRWRELLTPNIAIAGYAQYSLDTTGGSWGALGFGRGQPGYGRNWAKKIAFAGRGHHGGMNGGNNGDANCTIRISLGGKTTGGTGDILTSKGGIGFKYIVGSELQLVVSKGDSSALTITNTGFTPALRQTFDWKIESDGAGNVTCYINDSVVATATNGPVLTAENFNIYFEQVESTAPLATRCTFNVFSSKVYWSA